MALRMVLGLAMTALAFTIAGRRLAMLYRLGRAAQPVEPGRTRGVAARVRAELTEVLGQRKLLTWTVPGVAHVLAFWGFWCSGSPSSRGTGRCSSATSTSR